MIRFSWGLFGINMAYASSHSSLLVYSAVYNILHVKLKTGRWRSVAQARSTRNVSSVKHSAAAECLILKKTKRWSVHVGHFLIDLNLVNSKKEKNSTMLKDYMDTRSNHKWDYETRHKHKWINKVLIDTMWASNKNIRT